MLGLVISLLIIALVVIINDIRIMNNNLTRFWLYSLFLMCIFSKGYIGLFMYIGIL